MGDVGSRVHLYAWSERRRIQKLQDESDSLFSGFASRRGFLGAMGELALGAAGAIYASSKLPRVYAQAFYVGILSVPVNLDGHVEKDEWYSDAIDYKSTSNAFVTRMKRDKEDTGYTYFGMDIPVSKAVKSTMNFYFDRKSSNDRSPGADGVYNLVLDNTRSAPEFREIDRLLSGRLYPGTPFYKAFEKGEDKDYEWKTFIGPSELNSTDHLQVEVKVRSDKISPIPESSNQILFYNGYDDADVAAWLSPQRTPLISKEEVLPDLQSTDVVSFAAVLVALTVLTLAKPRLPRRELVKASLLAAGSAISTTLGL